MAQQNSRIGIIDKCIGVCQNFACMLAKIAWCKLTICTKLDVGSYLSLQEGINILAL